MTLTIIIFQKGLTDYHVSNLVNISRQLVMIHFNTFYSVVSDLLMNESLADRKPKQESLTKSDDSGHDSGQSSMNTGTKFFL